MDKHIAHAEPFDNRTWAGPVPRVKPDGSEPARRKQRHARGRRPHRPADPPYRRLRHAVRRG